MNIRKKAVAIAGSAGLLASLFTVVAAPTALASVVVGSTVVAPAGGTSPTQVSITFTENSAACFAVGAQSPALLVTITDFASASTVHWSGTPTVTAPGSLGATTSLQTAVASNDQLRINFAASDAGNIEIFTVTGVAISADAAATAGAIKATLTGPAAACVLPGTASATGTLQTSQAAGATSFLVNVTSTCPFVAVGSGPGPAGHFFINAVDAGATGTASAVVAGQQTLSGLTPAAFPNATTAGQAVTQASVPNCSASIGSPGTVSNNVGQTSSVTQKGNNPTTVNPGEQNQPAGTITLTENSPGYLPVGTLTFTISPAGVKFSAPPLVTSTTTPLATVTGLTATPNNGGGGACAAGALFYKVTTLTAAGESTASAAAGATVVTAGSTVVVTWTAVAGATGYKIYGRPATAGGVYGLIGTVGAVTTFTDACTVAPGAAPPGANTAALPAPTGFTVTPNPTGGVLPIGNCTYGLSAITPAGETALAAPGGVGITVAFSTTTSSATITWNAVAGATGYIVYRVDSTGGCPLPPGVNHFLVGNVTTFTDTGAPPPVPGAYPTFVTPATIDAPTVVTATPSAAPPGALVAGTYFYKVTATNAAGETLPSAGAGATIATGPGSVTLNWTAVAGATGYKIYGRPATVGGVYGLIGTVGAVTTFTDTGATVPGAAPPIANTTAGTAATVGTVCSLSFDRTSCTVSVTAVGSGSPTTVTLSGPGGGGILLDVDATVPPGTAVDVTVTSSATLVVLVSSKTIAYVARVVVGIAAQPIIFINYNDQPTGTITLTEQGAGFFTGGTGSNNVFGLCILTGEAFTRAPWAIVTVGDLKLNSAGLPVASVLGSLFTDPGGRSCVRWTVYTASTVTSTVEIRGSDSAGAILPSGPNNGPRLSVPGASTPGTTQGVVLIGSAANVGCGNQVVGGAGCALGSGPAPGVTGAPGTVPAFSKLVSMATRAFKDSVVVAATGQPRILQGSTGSLAGNVVITETLNGQLKAGQLICLQIQPRASNFSIQDTWFDSANQNTLPIVTTNAASGLLVGPVIVGGAAVPGCPTAPGGDARGVAGFTVTQQSFGPTLGQITISNIKYVVAADAPNGPVLLRVFVPPGFPGVQFSTTVTNAIIGPAIVLGKTGIIASVAPGVSRSTCNTDTVPCEFKSKTPTVNSGAPGKHAYVTIRWRVSGIVSGKVIVYWQKKAIGVPFTQGWPGVYAKVTTVVVSNGWAYYFADAKVLNANNPFHASFIGVVVPTATTDTSRAKAVQANWKP